MSHEDPEESLIPAEVRIEGLFAALWIEEAERRLQDYLAGKVEAVPGEEALQRIRASLR